MRVGFAGPRRLPEYGMPWRQLTALYDLLRGLRPDWLHHGDCEGADVVVHRAARNLGIPVELHPPSDPKWRAFCEGAAVVHDPRPAPERTRTIVRVTDCLIAAPSSTQERMRGSGTWLAIRAARRLGKPCAVVFPDGTVRADNWDSLPITYE